MKSLPLSGPPVMVLADTTIFAARPAKAISICKFNNHDFTWTSLRLINAELNRDLAVGAQDWQRTKITRRSLPYFTNGILGQNSIPKLLVFPAAFGFSNT